MGNCHCVQLDSPTFPSYIKVTCYARLNDGTLGPLVRGTSYEPIYTTLHQYMINLYKSRIGTYGPNVQVIVDSTTDTYYDKGYYDIKCWENWTLLEIYNIFGRVDMTRQNLRELYFTVIYHDDPIVIPKNSVTPVKLDKCNLPWKTDKNL